MEGLPGATYVARFIDEPRSKRPPSSRAEPRDLMFVSQVVRVQTAPVDSDRSGPSAAARPNGLGYPANLGDGMRVAARNTSTPFFYRHIFLHVMADIVPDGTDQTVIGTLLNDMRHPS